MLSQVAAFEALEQPLVVVGKQGAVQSVNGAWRRMRRELGHPTDVLIGRPFAEVCLQDAATGEEVDEGADERRKEDTAELYAGLIAVLSNRLRRCVLELTYPGRCFTVTVTALSDSADKVAGAVISFLEVTEQRRYERLIEDQANRDPLTGPFNRRFSFQEAERALARSRVRREGAGSAVLYLDLDRFKRVNDRYGHASGDALLHEVSLRLEALTRKGDLLTRLSGDEFAVLLRHVSREEGQKALARYKTNLSAPFGVKGGRVYLTGSFGLAHYPEDGENVTALLAHAAMYRAKRAESRADRRGIDASRQVEGEPR